MYCLLMGVTMIERTDLPREKKDELVGLICRHRQFVKYMYSVLIHYIIGLRVENFAAVDDLTNRYNKVLEQLTRAVKDVESDKISADDLTAAFLRFPTNLALGLFGSVSTLLAQNLLRRGMQEG